MSSNCNSMDENWLQIDISQPSLNVPDVKVVIKPRRHKRNKKIFDIIIEAPPPLTRQTGIHKTLDFIAVERPKLVRQNGIYKTETSFNT